MNTIHIDIPLPDEKAYREASAKMLQLAKIPHSLGKLEPLAIKIAAMKACATPQLQHKSVVLFAGDHHITRHGLSATGQEVTYMQTENFALGGGTINAFARNAGARFRAVDVSVDYDFKQNPQITHRKVMNGCHDFSQGPAMSREQAIQSIQTGIDIAHEEYALGLDIIAAGEMGIGNTTPSSAIVAIMTGTPVEVVTGRGSGVNNEAVEKKITLIKQGIDRNQPDKNDPIDVLSKVGGCEIGAMAGLMLGAASHRIPIVIDGFIAGAAAALAQAINPHVAHYFIGSHNSAEPGHQIIMQHIGVETYMDWGLCLGEGTGAALFFPILEASTRILTEMRTLSDLGIVRNS